MQRTDLFTLVTDNNGKSSLHTANGSQSVLVKGLVLEEQFLLNNGWLLVLTTEDSPYEEALHATLLSSTLQVMDYAEVSGEMTPGILEDVLIVDEDRIKFSLNRDTLITLEVDSSGFTFPPFSDLSKRPFRRYLRKKYLRIR